MFLTVVIDVKKEVVFTYFRSLYYKFIHFLDSARSHLPVKICVVSFRGSLFYFMYR